MQADRSESQVGRSVLIFSIEFPPHLGGAATYARNLCVGLSETGQDVTVLTISRRQEVETEARIDKALLESNRIAVKRVRFIPKIYLLVMARSLRRLVSQRNFSALIIADSGAQKSSAFFLRLPDMPAWTVFHGSEGGNYFGKSTLPLRLLGAPARMRKLFSRLNGCVAVSHWIRSQMVGLLPELEGRCKVVHHGVEFDERVLAVSRNDAKASLDIDTSKHVVFSASRLIDEKGQDVLLRAFAIAAKEDPDLFLVIAGDGPARPGLEALAAAEGVSDRVLFMGKLDSPRMTTCYRACDVFAQPSRYPFDSFGLVYLEANACGRAVIAGNIAGIPESVEDGVSGFLVDPLDTDRISRLLLKFVRDKEFRSRLERGALERVRSEFSLEAMARKTADLLFSEA